MNRRDFLKALGTMMAALGIVPAARSKTMPTQLARETGPRLAIRRLAGSPYQQLILQDVPLSEEIRVGDAVYLTDDGQYVSVHNSNPLGLALNSGRKGEFVDVVVQGPFG